MQFKIQNTKRNSSRISYSSTYDYHFKIEQLAKEFEARFECLGENTEKYYNFSVLIKRELDNSKKIIYKLKFIDSFRFMFKITIKSR